MDIATGNAGPSEFRLLLQDELERRCKKNPRFSLRAFARSLSIEPSALSKILHGKRALTPKMLTRIATHLGMSEQEISRYIPHGAVKNKNHGSTHKSYPSERDLERGGLHKSISISIAKQLLPEAESLIENLQKDMSRLAQTAAEGELGQDQESYQLDIIFSPRN